MTTWTLTTDMLPAERVTVLIANKGGAIFTSRLVKRGGGLCWNTAFGSWPLDRVKAWCLIPRIDVEI